MQTAWRQLYMQVLGGSELNSVRESNRMGKVEGAGIHKEGESE